MEYTFKQIDEVTYELRVGTIIFLFDTEDLVHAQMISDFSTSNASIERFVDLLNADPSNAYDIYNGTI